MVQLRIHHRTTYFYRRRIVLGPHRLMLRPRESLDLRLISMKVATFPASVLSWTQDVFGNAVATASFGESSETLTVESSAELEHYASAWPVFEIAGSAMNYPFRHSNDEWTDLGALTRPQYADPAGRLQAWARSFVRSNPTNTLALLKDLNAGIPATVRYQSRDEEGTQTPLHTLDRGWGSCRDFAVLLAEAARSLGFGARIVSGYLHTPGTTLLGSTDAGTTHAWTEIYVPGAGWITFDPTNGGVGASNLVPVSVARTIEQTVPVAGTYVGASDDSLGMSVEVRVTS
ncbi:transglutaminase family protein [Roseixanthobacter pseudopolyaromaticivorans]|uniref:transglutaminase family protein n=1 Tax=Xanthobacteraceae TaxID=335928 RepID=UPI00372A1F9A